MQQAIAMHNLLANFARNMCINTLMITDMQTHVSCEALAMDNFLANCARNIFLFCTSILMITVINWHMTQRFVYVQTYGAIRLMLNVSACACVTKLRIASNTQLFPSVGEFVSLQSAFLEKPHFAYITCKRPYSSV